MPRLSIAVQETFRGCLQCGVAGFQRTAKGDGAERKSWDLTHLLAFHVRTDRFFVWGDQL